MDDAPRFTTIASFVRTYIDMGGDGGCCCSGGVAEGRGSSADRQIEPGCQFAPCRRRRLPNLLVLGLR